MKKRIVLRTILLVNILTLSLLSEEILLPFYRNYQFGYINEEGEEIIKPKFELADDFYDNRALVKIKGITRYIDKGGNFIKGKYLYGNRYSDGLAKVTYNNKLSKFIDIYGNDVIPAQDSLLFYSAYFVNGFIIVENKDKKKNYMNQKGIIVFSKWYDSLKECDGKVAPVKIADKWGVISINEEIIVEPIFDNLNSFNEGIAVFEKNGEYGLIDSTGSIVLNTKYAKIRDMSEGLAAFEVNGKWGFMDRYGKTIIEPKFDYVEDFSEGLAAYYPYYKHGLEYFGFIDKMGKVQLKPLYYGRGSFKNKVCRIHYNFTISNPPMSSWFYIDKNGCAIWDPEKKVGKIKEIDLVEIEKNIK